MAAEREREREREREIENLSFYAYGRTESNLEAIAHSHGIPVAEIAARVFNLFQHTSGREFMGNANHMSVVFGASSVVQGRGEPLALAERSHGDVQVQGRPKGNTRDIVVAALRDLKPPLAGNLLRDLIQERAGLERQTIYGVLANMVKRGELTKTRGANGKSDYSWPVNGVAPVVKNESPKPSAKRVVSKLLLEYISKMRAPQTQEHICQHLRSKHAEVAKPAWNVVINGMVSRGVLSRSAAGIITLSRKG
jgi:hypothetical protein